VSKHLAVLRGAGLVLLNRRLYQVPAHYIAAAANHPRALASQNQADPWM
jgi:DNA-binding transcriptional ArsR family regulator